MREKMAIRKWYWVWEFEKEERWLNEMAMNGWALASVGFCRYTFEPCEPGEYIVRLEMHDSDDAYISFLEEIGAEYLGRVVKWIYIRRRSELGPFDLFSDIDSKLGHLKRIHRMVLFVGIANLLIGFGNSINATHIGWVNLLLASLLMYGCGILKGRIDDLEIERELRE